MTSPAWKTYRPSEEPDWKISSIGFDPAREREMETLLALGNGYLGIRGSMDMPIPSSAADLFISGVYDHKSEILPYSESEFMIPPNPKKAENGYRAAEIVPLPFPFRVSISANERSLDFFEPGNPEHESTLDLKQGLSFEKYHYHWVGPEGRQALLIDTLRCCSLNHPHLLLQEIELRAQDREVPVSLNFSLDDPDLELTYPHLEQLGGDSASVFRTRNSGIEIAYCSRLHLRRSGAGLLDQIQEVRGPIQIVVKPGERVRLRRMISVFNVLTHAETAGSGQATALASEHLREYPIESFDDLLAEHLSAWSERWQQADVVIQGSPSTTQAMRFNLYHLMIAAGLDPPNSIGARTLSGRAYGGHIFWDVEIFMLPFFCLNFPKIARKLLEYRYRTLEGARRRAKEFGCLGACYAWESTLSGDDVTPSSIMIKSSRQLVPVFTGTQQIHISADIAYGIWNYWNLTLDDEFMIEMGAEILFETARFWRTRSTLRDGKYHLFGVVGPDEYHHSVNDNAFTNWMAHFNVSAALSCYEWLKKSSPQRFSELSAQLSLLTEVGEWQQYLQDIHLPGPDATGVIEQFEGFFQLKPATVPRDERFRAPYHRLVNWRETSDTRLVKQADVLMLFFLFPGRFPSRIVEANYRYYEPITDHASSLSPPVHAAIAAQLGFGRDAEYYFKRALELDLQNLMNNTALGVHAACMGATWQALVQGYLGLRFDTEGFHLANPRAAFPRAWNSVELNLRYRGRRIPLAVAREPSKEAA